ncbi:MAG: nicotinate-nucleotide--dimethylbenzimidazole phosphoribosyltransferase [Rhodobacteraceae bacterium]|nr:nicotinate-nucleotide--dimethylbenzimidazole phosphoribosyltransferase [Paracoccaceae bacterium]
MSGAAFTSINGFLGLVATALGPDARARAAAQDRNRQLTKPPGSLGRLENLAIWYAGWRGMAAPRISAPQIAVFAGNHGVAALGVSAFPAQVTEQMVLNFQNGGAAINQLARTFGAKLTVEALALDKPTADFTRAPAMSEEELVSALRVGWNSLDPDTDLLAIGEMGIANTTSASALGCALFGGPAADWVGRGTGVDEAGLARKEKVVDSGVTRHKGGAGLELLRRLGGREMAAMVGAIARARVDRVPVILDGFICTAAAAALEAASAGALDHALAGHQSEEPAHATLLQHLGKTPLLQLGLRLGEGSGAATAIGIVQAAVNCHAGMATFAEAGVSDG